MPLAGQSENIGGLPRQSRKANDGDDAQKEIRWLVGVSRFGGGVESGVPSHSGGVYPGTPAHGDEVCGGAPYLPILQGGGAVPGLRTPDHTYFGGISRWS